MYVCICKYVCTHLWEYALYWIRKTCTRVSMHAKLVFDLKLYLLLILCLQHSAYVSFIVLFIIAILQSISWSLCGNSIGTKGGKALANGWRSNSTLRSLKYILENTHTHTHTHTYIHTYIHTDIHTYTIGITSNFLNVNQLAWKHPQYAQLVHFNYCCKRGSFR